jgi:hypothetical protein
MGACRCHSRTVQALRCVEVMSLLMQEHLGLLVEAGLQCYLSLWQAYAMQPDSLSAYAGYPAGLTPDGLQPLAAAADDANLAWRAARVAQQTGWGSDVFCPSPPPMFQLQLLVRDARVQYVPSLEETQAAVLGMVDAIVQAGQSVEDLAAKVRCVDWSGEGMLAVWATATTDTSAANAALPSAGQEPMLH